MCGACPIPVWTTDEGQVEWEGDGPDNYSWDNTVRTQCFMRPDDGDGTIFDGLPASSSDPGLLSPF